TSPRVAHGGVLLRFKIHRENNILGGDNGSVILGQNRFRARADLHVIEWREERRDVDQRIHSADERARSLLDDRNRDADISRLARVVVTNIADVDGSSGALVDTLPVCLLGLKINGWLVRRGYGSGVLIGDRNSQEAGIQVAAAPQELACLRGKDSPGHLA